MRLKTLPLIPSSSQKGECFTRHYPAVNQSPLKNLFQFLESLDLTKLNPKYEVGFPYKSKKLVKNCIIKTPCFFIKPNI